MFKFNGGCGALICDICRVVVQSPAPADSVCAGAWNDVDLCRECGKTSFMANLTRSEALAVGRILVERDPLSAIGRGLVILAGERLPDDSVIACLLRRRFAATMRTVAADLLSDLPGRAPEDVFRRREIAQQLLDAAGGLEELGNGSETAGNP